MLSRTGIATETIATDAANQRLRIQGFVGRARPSPRSCQTPAERSGRLRFRVRERPSRRTSDSVSATSSGRCASTATGSGSREAEGYDLDEQMLAGLDRALEVTSPVEAAVADDHERRHEDRAACTSPGPKRRARLRRARNEIGFTHLSFFVDDVDRVAAHLAALGGEVLARQTRRQLGYEVVFVADPDGARVELMARPRRA